MAATAMVTTEAILLASHPYSETSRVVKFYTRELGLVGAMAKGIGRRASKGREGVSTFAEGMAVMAVRKGRALQSLYEFTPTCAHLGLGRDMSRLGGASVAAELVLRHADSEPDPALYVLLSDGLSRLEEAASDDVLAEVLALAWSTAGIMGYSPELSRCLVCGGNVPSSGLANFAVEAGGVTHPGCSVGGRLRSVGPRARDQIRSLLGGRVPEDLVRMHAHLSLLHDFLTAHLLGGRRLVSFPFLELTTKGPAVRRAIARSRRAGQRSGEGETGQDEGL